MKIKDVSKVLGLASLLAVGGAMALAGCDGSDDGNDGGAGGQGGETATGGTSSGGTQGCDPTFGGQGGGGGEGGAASSTIEIEGTYTDSISGSTVVFGPESIQLFDDVFTYVEIDAEARWVVTENGADNAFNPGLFSRFVWIFEGSSLYYCQDPYAAESADAASTAELPDSSDLDEGCGGFAWSQLLVACP